MITWKCYHLNTDPNREGEPVLIEAKWAADAARAFAAYHLEMEDNQIADVFVVSEAGGMSRHRVTCHLEWEHRVFLLVHLDQPPLTIGIKGSDRKVWKCYDFDNDPNCEEEPVLLESMWATDAARTFAAQHLEMEDGHVAHVLVSSEDGNASRHRVTCHVSWEFYVTDVPLRNS